MCESSQNLTSDTLPSEKGPQMVTDINFEKLGHIPIMRTFFTISLKLELEKKTVVSLSSEARRRASVNTSLT